MSAILACLYLYLCARRGFETWMHFVISTRISSASRVRRSSWSAHIFKSSSYNKNLFAVCSAKAVAYSRKQSNLWQSVFQLLLFLHFLYAITAHLYILNLVQRTEADCNAASNFSKSNRSVYRQMPTFWQMAEELNAN